MKKQIIQSARNFSTTIALAGVLVLFSAGIAVADPPDRAMVIPPHSGSTMLYGKTYGEWSIEQWKWVYSLPSDHHPLFDTADISAGQSGDVWFLGGTYNNNPNGDGTKVTGKAKREGAIPFGKALFFPLIAATGTTAEGNGTTDPALRDVAESYINGHAQGLSCVIDGHPVKDLARYLVESPLFTFTLPPTNNIIGPAFNGQSSSAVSSGYFIMIAPLSRGMHIIHYKGKTVSTQAKDGFDFTFSLDITYRLTVE